jgi:sugar phosphate isomerase/epimerase
MEEKRGYTISDIYQGGYSTLISPENSYSAAGSLGMTTNPGVANVLQEVSTKLSSGAKHVDVTAVSPEVFDSMPKPYLKEVNRLAKLTGVDISMHGPVIDVSGIDPRGGGNFSEAERETSERKVAEALLRSHDLNPDGNIMVNFHTSEGISGSEFIPPSQRKEGEKYKRLMAINRESGRIAPLETEKEFHLGLGIKEPVEITPERRLVSLNNTEWKNSMFQVEVNRENAERIMRDVHPIIAARFSSWKTGALDPKKIPQSEYNEMKKLNSAWEFIDQANQSANTLFSKAVEAAKADNDEKKLKILSKISEEYGESTGIKDGKINPEMYANPKAYSEAIFNLTQKMESIPPNLWVKLEDFQTEKTAQTFGNAAWTAYSKYKDTSPVLVIENPPATHALSKGEEVRNVVEKSREQFIRNAKENGLSESEARKQAEKLIGATWDVGHINMLRKFGYSEEEITEEAGKVAPVLKMVHLSDNFGFEHTELPMGMGNVPLKEVMAKLGQKGYDAKKIIEAGHWWNQFKTPPFQETLEALGSPLYSMKMAPYWNQAPNLVEGYFGGYGQMLPQMHYETFGAGFSRLPAELGGQSPGAQGSRMSGRGME